MAQKYVGFGDLTKEKRIHYNNKKRKNREERKMRFRPCIDIHNGQVKQIVGGSLNDEHDFARENFVSRQDAAWYAQLYQEDGLKGLRKRFPMGSRFLV